MHDDALHSEARQDRDELERVLDSALASYVEPGPSSGLEARILASTTRADSRPNWLRWLPWAIPALAALLLIAIFLSHHTAPPHQKSPVANSPALPRPTMSSPPVSVASVASTPPQAVLPRPAAPAHVTALEGQVLPRLEVFPTPAPLSPQEQALLALVNRNSQDLAQQITQPAAQPQPVEPLRIAAIHISPLNPPDNNSN